MSDTRTSAGAPHKVESILYRATLLLSCTAIAAMVALTFVDVLGRQFFSAVPGASEIISMLLGIAFYAGMSAVERNRSHIVVGILVERYPPRWQKIEAMVTQVVSAASMALIAWLIINQAGKLLATRTITEFLGARVGYVAYAMGALAAVACVWSIVGLRGAADGHGARR